MNTLKVLLVGGVAGNLEAVRSRLSARGLPYALDPSSTPVPGYDLVLANGNAPGFSLTALLEALSTTGAPPPVVVLTDEREEETAHWLWSGAYDVLRRPGFASLPSVLVRLRREADQVAQRQERETRLQQATRALLKLTHSPAFAFDQLERAYEEVTEAAARGTHTGRVSLWLFEDDGIRCADLYLAQSATHTKGHFLSFKDYPKYFKALTEQRQLCLSNVYSDARTIELAEAYCRPLTIGAMLDTGVVLRGATQGVLCLEHLGSPRSWSSGDQVYASALADLVSLALEAHQRSDAERRAEVSEGRFRELFENSKDTLVFYRVTENGQLVVEDVNPAGEALVARPRAQIIGKTPSEVLGPEAADKLLARHLDVIRGRQAIAYEHELPMPTGRVWFNTSLIPLFENGKVTRIAAIARNVTEARQLAAQLADARKSEALARLATAVAHDFNNLLAAIAGWAQQARNGAAEPETVRDAADELEKATQRGRDLTRQVLTFGRPVQEPPTPHLLAELAEEALRLLQPSIPAGIRVVRSIDPRVRVRASSGQLQQILSNLLNNALQAMSATGTLTVAVDMTTVSDAFAASHPPLSAGRAARLTIADTGSGMDDGTLSRIFEPFFTTKPGGKGSGLGLAVSLGLAHAHAGTIVAFSEPGKGSRFEVLLPLLSLERPSRPRLMLVDDEPNVASTSARLLEDIGYATTVYGAAQEALTAFEQQPYGFDLVLTDLTMPDFDGAALTQRLHQLRPELPVVICSGRPLSLEELTKVGAQGTLTKPWRLEEAKAALASVLG
ncbi:MAG: response regulator [Myxococcaceae bacterium]